MHTAAAGAAAVLHVQGVPAGNGILHCDGCEKVSVMSFLCFADLSHAEMCYTHIIRPTRMYGMHIERCRVTYR